MDKQARKLLLVVLLLCSFRQGRAADARFDLVGPKIEVRVTRANALGTAVTLPIASVPNLQPGDKLWIHPDLPATQSVKYLLICVFLRGTTNPPPDEWFIRIETWDKKVRQEGTFVSVPAEAQQALLFMAPETGGDFSTLKSAVRGRPGAFVRATQDLNEASFEEARLEKYIADIRRVPPSDAAELQKHSDLLARTLALKPNSDCFKRPVDVQFTCLTQTGSQVVLDDGHGHTVVDALNNGSTSDLINQASYTRLGGGGIYSAYVGAIVDMVRIMGSLHTAQYQYIPTISFPQAEAMNLRLNTPPSFHNPKSVLVIGLPAIQKATPPPLRPADANHVTCLIEPSVVIPVEGAPLVFSADFAHNLVLHLNTPPGAPVQPDIPLTPDAYQGGLILQHAPQHHILLREELPAGATAIPEAHRSTPDAVPAKAPTQPEPVLLTGTIQGSWGFDPFTGPTVPLQQLPGGDWHIVIPESTPANLIAGHSAEILLTSTGTACVHTITARPTGRKADITLPFKNVRKPDAKSGDPNLLALTLPLEHDITPGDLHLAIQQFDQPKSDQLSARTFSEPPSVSSIELHAGDRSIVLKGTHLSEIDHLSLGDLNFSPTPDSADETPAADSLHLTLPTNSPAPPTHLGDSLTAKLTLHDGRTLSIPVTVSSPRPVITLIGKSATPTPNSTIALTNPEDLPLNSILTFTLKSPTNFPRNGQIEIETIDGTLRTVLTLAPSGGLLLQDPHTIVATLDPLRSFGTSAFGALHLRAIYPPNSRSDNSKSDNSRSDNSRSDNSKSDALRPDTPAPPASDWLPLVTLIRLPTLTLLQCPTDPTQPCTLTGSSFYLLQSIATDAAFTTPVPVPDGYTGTTLSIPHPTAATLFLKLRDDPTAIDSAILPTPPPTHHSSQHPTQSPTKQEGPASPPSPPVTPSAIPATPTPLVAAPSAPGYGSAHKGNRSPTQSLARQTAVSM